MSKRRRIKVVAVPQDPVVVNRLVRVLIAQAQLELNQQQLRQRGASSSEGDASE